MPFKTFSRPFARLHLTSPRRRNDVGPTPNIHLRPIADLVPACTERRIDEEMTLTRLFPDLPKTPFDLLSTHMQRHSDRGMT